MINDLAAANAGIGGGVGHSCLF